MTNGQKLLLIIGAIGMVVLFMRMLSTSISGDEARRLVGEGALLLDVRTTREFAAGHITGAVNLPVQDLPSRMDELDRKRHIVVYCRSGSRSARAKRLLDKSGFEQVSDLGSMSSW